MKKLNVALIVVTLVALTAPTASADPWIGPWRGTTYDFVDVIDDWDFLFWEDAADAVLITENRPLQFEHDITGFGIPDEWLVTEAWLELDFTNADGLFGLEGDGTGTVWIPFVGTIPYDNREFVRIAYDGSGWTQIGEQDDGYYTHDLILDIGLLNDDGLLDVTVEVYNDLGTADIWLDHSALYGNVEAVPVPGAALLGVLGLSAAGMKLRRRKSA